MLKQLISAAVAFSFSMPAQAEPDAGSIINHPGVVRVIEARRGSDAGTPDEFLGPGWWLSDERMLATGQHITKTENARAEAEAARRAAFDRLPYAFAIGVVAGFGAAFGAYKLINDVVRK